MPSSRAERAQWAVAERERLTVSRRNRARHARAFEAALEELQLELRESITYHFSRTDIPTGADETDDVEKPLADGTGPTLGH